MDLNKLFPRIKDRRVVDVPTGVEVIVNIPKSYEAYTMLRVTDVVTTLGVFEIKIKDDSCGFFFPAVLTMCPTTTTNVVVDGRDMLQCVFVNGDTFIKNCNLVKNAYLAYVIFTEFIQKGKVPNFVDYDTLSFMFEYINEVTGANIPAGQSACAILVSHIARDQDNVRLLYRHTDMTRLPKYLKIDDVAHASISTTARLVGGYLMDGINTDLINENDIQSDIEDLLRQ